MTIVSTLSICLAVVCAFLLGRSAVISNRRYNRNKQLKAEVKKLKHRLDRIADSSKYDRYYEIEEDECANAYNVNMKVYVRVLPTQANTLIPAVIVSSSNSPLPMTRSLQRMKPRNYSINSTRNNHGKTD